MEKKTLLNKKGQCIYELKGEYEKLSPEIKELIKNIINIDEEHLIIKDFTKKEFEEVLIKEHSLSQEECLLKYMNSLNIKNKWDYKINQNKVDIIVYIGFTKGQYCSYMNESKDLKKPNELKTAMQISNSLLSSLINKVLKELDIYIPASRKIVISTSKLKSNAHRFLDNREIILSFPYNYIDNYKKLGSQIIKPFIEEVWLLIEKYKLW